MSTDDIPWGHTSTSLALHTTVIAIMRTPYSGPRGVRWCSVRPSAGGEWTEFATGPDAPAESAITDKRTETRLVGGEEVDVEVGGISIRFGLLPHPAPGVADA